MSDANRPTDPTNEGASPLVVPLIGSHRLEVDTRDPDEHRLLLRLPTGGAALRVAITAAGVQLELMGGDLALRASGEISIDADRVALHGRRGLAITSGGDARIEAARALHLEAEAQAMIATQGDVHIQANDDVRVDGERIKLNS